MTFSDGVYRLTEQDRTIWQFNADLSLNYIQDANGNRITLGYTEGLPTTVGHSCGTQILLEYNEHGRITRLIEPLGPGTEDDRVTTYGYDSSGQYLLTVEAPATA